MIFIANVGFQYSIEADNEKEAERIMLEKYEESINHSYEQLKKGIHSTPILIKEEELKEDVWHTEDPVEEGEYLCWTLFRDDKEGFIPYHWHDNSWNLTDSKDIHFPIDKSRVLFWRKINPPKKKEEKI